MLAWLLCCGSGRAVWAEGEGVAEAFVGGWVATSQRGRRTCRSEVVEVKVEVEGEGEGEPAGTNTSGTSRAEQGKAVQCRLIEATG